MRQTCESERENGGNNDAERERTSESEIEDLGAQLDKACCLLYTSDAADE